MARTSRRSYHPDPAGLDASAGCAKSLGNYVGVTDRRRDVRQADERPGRGDGRRTTSCCWGRRWTRAAPVEQKPALARRIVERFQAPAPAAGRRPTSIASTRSTGRRRRSRRSRSQGAPDNGLVHLPGLLAGPLRHLASEARRLLGRGGGARWTATPSGGGSRPPGGSALRAPFCRSAAGASAAVAGASRRRPRYSPRPCGARIGLRRAFTRPLPEPEFSATLEHGTPEAVGGSDTTQTKSRLRGTANRGPLWGLSSERLFFGSTTDFGGPA